MSLLRFPLEELPFFILAMLVAFTVHEFAHAWTAYKFGDDTAQREGRVSLNPMVHLDWIGLLFLLLAGFGWAKPVPFRRSNFRRPRLMTILVTAAGPFSNFLLAALGVMAIYIWYAAGIPLSGAAFDTFWTLMKYWLQINLVLLLFNLIPVPPLDGYRIAEEFMSLRVRIMMMRYEQWSFFIFLLMIFIPPLRNVTIGPLFSLIEPILMGLSRFFSWIFGGPQLLLA